MKKTAHTMILFFCIFTAAACLSGKAASAQELFFLTPVHNSETKDFYNYHPLEALEDIRYFIVVCSGIEAQITTLTIKLSASPMMKSYEGRVTYGFFAVGAPGIFFADVETATDSTATSNSIKADFPINASFGFAIVGAAVLSRSEADDEVKMTIKCSVE